MANNLLAQRITQIAFAEALAEMPAAFTRFSTTITEAPGTLKIGGAAVGGLARELGDNATSATSDDMASLEASLDSVEFYKKHTVPAHVLEKDYALKDAGIALANMCGENINKQFWDGLEGSFTASHPRAGTAVGCVGASKKYLDAGLKYLIGEDNEGTQDNLLTTAFSATAVDAALQLLLNYKSDRGLNLTMGQLGGLVLAVAPKNRKLAVEVLKSAVSSNAMQYNTLGDLISDVVIYPFSTDADDWFLTDPRKSPCGIWLAKPPVVEIRPQSDGLFVDIVAKWTSAFYRKPFEAGLIGSNVA